MKKYAKVLIYILFVLYILGIVYITLFSRGRAVNDLSIWEYARIRGNLIPFKTISIYVKWLKNGNDNTFVPLVNLFVNLFFMVPMSIILPFIWDKFKKFIPSMLFSLLFLMLIELLQLFTERGSFDVDDLILNMMGAGLGYLIYYVNQRKANKKKKVGENMLAVLAKRIKGYIAPSVLTPICMILEVIFETIIPYCMGALVDNGVYAGDMKYIIKMGIIMACLTVGGLISGILGGVFGAQASCGFAKNLRRDMYENIQKFSFSNIDKFSTGSLITRLTTDTTNVQNAYQMILRMCFRAPVSMIFAMVMAYTVSARIANIYLYAVIALSIILALIMLSAMKAFSAVFAKYDDLNSTIQENVNAIRVVKAFVREDYESEELKKAAGNIYKMFVKAENRVILNGPVMQLTIFTTMIIISWIGAHMVVGGDLTTGDLMTLITYCLNILANLMMISFMFVMLSISSAGAKRISEVLMETPDLADPEEPVTEVKDGSIEFENVCFSYKKDAKEYVIKNVNLSIKAGQTIGVIGGTGSAKTSLVNLINRLYDVNEGSVKVGGVDVRNYKMDVLRDEVSVVLQKNVLFSGTILENLRWGNENATEEECINACKIACADDFITSFPDGYNTKIEQGGTNVSGGQKQRLCIARAILKEPKVLIFDDSTSAVDTATDARIRKSLKEGLPSSTILPETTKIIIAQRISSVMDADKIIVMEEGEINGFGTHEELLSNNSIYKEVYESQTGANADFDEVNGGDN